MKIKLFLLLLLSLNSFATDINKIGINKDDIDKNGVYVKDQNTIKEINIDVKKYDSLYTDVNKNIDINKEELDDADDSVEKKLPLISLSKKVEKQTNSGMFFSIFGAYNDISGSYYETKTAGAAFNTKNLTSTQDSNKFGGGALIGYKVVTPGDISGYFGFEMGGIGFFNDTHSGNFIDANNDTQTASHSLKGMGLIDMKMGFALFQTVSIYGIIGAGIPISQSKITGLDSDGLNINRTKVDVGLIYGGGVEVMFKYGSIFANVVKYYSSDRNVGTTLGITEHQDMFMVYSGFSIKLF